MTADLTRYLPGNDGAGRLALWCTDCAENPAHDDSDPIWTEDDAPEQVTELCLANLVAIAETHERQHHADAHETRRGTEPCPSCRGTGTHYETDPLDGEFESNDVCMDYDGTGLVAAGAHL